MLSRRNMLALSAMGVLPGFAGCQHPETGRVLRRPDKPRLLVSTDIGGTDPDDFQSMVHLLLYGDLVEIEGLVSSPFGPGRMKDILNVIDYYQADFSNIETWSPAYLSPDELRERVKQGATEVAPYSGCRGTTEGSDWIVHCARKDDPRPLHVLVWGGIEDLAQALHDAPDIKSSIRVYWIGGPNKKWSPDAYQYIAENHKDLWIIEANSTYRGWFVGGDQTGDLGNQSFVRSHIAGKGALGRFFDTQLEGTIKMGDTPSLGWALSSDPADPQVPSWGGTFVRAWSRPFAKFDRITTASDTIEVFGILELALSFDKNVAARSVLMDVENQSLVGCVEPDGVVRFRFCPKSSKTFEYRIRSDHPDLSNLAGAITAIDPSGDQPSASDLPNWWTDRLDPNLAEDGHFGVKSVSRWRSDYLNDFAQRMRRCVSSKPE